MPTKPQPLQQFANVTLDTNGNGTAQLGPSRVREHWQAVAVYVETTTPIVNESKCELYVGATPIPSQQFSTTGSGSSGDTCAMGSMDIQTGQYIICQWIGGDPGAIATMTVFGTYTIGAPE